ncbi:tRNA dihydrouridine synthase DusB [Natronospirillum operosum]|uniref:tRNA-dihydrouridine synthase B n=1 Tax=Natronospirillum operosum TaxID=2759953 RepID=A0A4Z0WGV6_9GAMM|nr:tRNA dihydrouridine synthase DusB [Natronospirillum operosum]TGG94986.1 tRNA dihydrouridine synthase DusB [Natronospirillum operosum]
MPTLTIGPHQIDPALVLAPMAGVTDRTFRRLCRQLGAGLAVSEMVTADTRLWNSGKSRLRLAQADDDGPVSVQIVGTEPTQLAEAARRNEALGADIIDINMGCPAKKVCSKAAGSALLRDEALVGRILSAVVAAVTVPVTLKIRTGWAPEERNGVTIARIAEQCGIRMLAVHGRTRACRFRPTVEYDTIRAVCAATEIPVLANGDIIDGPSARHVLDYTGADGLMIGRAAQGNPWIFREIQHYLATGEVVTPPNLEEQQAVLLEHLEGLYRLYGDWSGVRIARKHVGWYLQARADAKDVRKQFNCLETPDAQRKLIHSYFNRVSARQESDQAA